jgi:hypothetical protein
MLFVRFDNLRTGSCPIWRVFIREIASYLQQNFFNTVSGITGTIKSLADIGFSTGMPLIQKPFPALLWMQINLKKH